MVLPDRFMDHDTQPKQIAVAGLSAKDIVADALGGWGLRVWGRLGLEGHLQVAQHESAMVSSQRRSHHPELAPTSGPANSTSRCT